MAPVTGAARQTERLEDLKILDPKDAVIIGGVGVRDDVEEPLNGGECFYHLALVVDEAYFLPGGNNLQGVAGQRVERFDASIDGDRKFPKLVNLRFTWLRFRHRRFAHEITGKENDDQRGKQCF